MEFSWFKRISKEKIKNYITNAFEIVAAVTLCVLCLNLVKIFVPKIIDYVFASDTASENLPTCPDSEKIIVGYRDGKPMKICDQTYTFFAQDFNYSCAMTNGKEFGALTFARSSVAKDVLRLSEKQAVSYAERLAPTDAHCVFGKLNPKYVQMGYSGKGDGSKLTHTQTMGF